MPTTACQEIIELLKATIEGVDYTWTQREGTIDIIAKWMRLNTAQAAKAYDSVRDTFSKIGVPTEEQAKAYIAMLSATASVGFHNKLTTFSDYFDPCGRAKCRGVWSVPAFLFRSTRWQQV